MINIGTIVTHPLFPKQEGIVVSLFDFEWGGGKGAGVLYLHGLELLKVENLTEVTE